MYYKYWFIFLCVYFVLSLLCKFPKKISNNACNKGQQIKIVIYLCIYIISVKKTRPQRGSIQRNNCRKINFLKINNQSIFLLCRYKSLFMIFIFKSTSCMMEFLLSRWRSEDWTNFLWFKLCVSSINLAANLAFSRHVSNSEVEMATGITL